ncbi:protocadherin-8-like [Brienomyrus brachyistius]|uniref:protocadherin-8-like n=1 Tax=Brienomyrus brachyistius TaxID=42636 RepID=UPI0020B38580|nr:protocadherin-8-like [Brienomyrus brachyistius]
MASIRTENFAFFCHSWLFGLTFLHILALLPVASEGKTMKYQTYEEDSAGTVIGSLAKDMSLSPLNSKTNFKMMKQFNSSFIRLRESDGQLTIGERIDREKMCKHTLQCLIAFDVISFSKEQFKLVHVEVEIKDINDNPPEFSNKESTVEIFENTAVGSRIPLDVAVDADVGSNYIQSYQISVNSHFTIDVLNRADGVKYAELVLMKPLDRETQSSYVLELVATDGGNPSRSGTTKIHIKVKDYNDNSPIFDQNIFSVDLFEDAPVGFLLLDLNAIDPDEGLNGEVVYEFGNQVPAEIRQLFKVDRKTGRLTLESQIDFEAKKTYELDVQAHDLGPNPIPSMCKIIIHVQDVNDNAPEISITPMTSITAGIAYITEAAAKDSFVALISTSDSDSGANGEVRCTLYGHDHFKLQQAYEDSYMIVTTAPLDREKIAEYNLTVVAEDLGSPPFKTITQYTIRLSDENDNAPLFSKPVYEVSVVENNAPGAYITTVVARDPDIGNNGKVIYRLSDAQIMGSHVSTFVSLDPATGSIYALRSFNYEVMKQLEFRIQASDGGSPQLHGSAVISLKIVDQNDNAPAITQPALHNGSAEVLLPKDAPSGYIITQIKAIDADEGANGDLSYKIIKGDNVMFSMNKATGDIHLNRELNFDVSETLTVLVTVNDNGRPSLTCTATIFLTVVAGAPPSDRTMVKQNNEDSIQWDASTVIIAVLAGSCSLLLLAIVLIATTCNRHKQDKNSGGFEDKLDMGHMENGKSSHNLMSSHSGDMFSVTPYSKQSFTNLPKADSEMCSSSEDGSETTCVYESENIIRGSKLEGYSTLPGYGKEAVRPITIWKGNSYTTISARDPQFSGKDSGKGDSDFNDSDSDMSGDGIKKDFQHGLWACTTECKILGHSDRCWSPSAIRNNPSMPQGQHLSTFAKTASLPRNTLRRDTYLHAHIPKTIGLQSVYEKVLHTEFDYVLSSPSRPGSAEESSEDTFPPYAPPVPHK